MKITNVDDLPQIVVEALKNDTYKVGGWIGVTTLIDAVQIRHLKRKHHHEIEEDASDMLWALLGQCTHAVLERAHINDYRRRAFLTVIEALQKESGRFNENAKEKLNQMIKQLFAMMEFLFPEVKGRYMWETTLHYEYGGKLLYGTFDVYDKIDKILYDYKMCSVWAYAYEESRRKWRAQTNIYAFMLRKAGYPVTDIRIVAIFRDWSAAKVEFSKNDYPKKQLMVIPVPVQSDEMIESYIKKKMDMHIAAESGDVKECSGVDMWATADEYAVKKPGLKRAVRKFPTEDMAKTFIAENKHKFDAPLSIQIRPGERKRCQSYCPVSKFCDQKKRMDEEEEALEK